MQPTKAAAESANRFALVNASVVPDDDDVTAEMLQQMANERADFCLLDVLTVESVIEPGPLAPVTDRDSRDDGNAIVALMVTVDRSLSARCPRLADRRDEQESGFIYEDDVGPQPRRVFFMRGQSLRFHSSMRASSRSRARRSGFW